MRPGRVYAYSAEDLRLLISEDEGATWREFILERQPSFLATHPADPDYIYLGNLTIRDERNTRPGFLLHSADGGRTWRRRDLDRIFNSISPDPLDASGLYGIARNELLHSPDQGQTWQPIAIPAEEAIRAVYAPAPDVLYVRGDRSLWHSTDQGKNWQRVRFSRTIRDITTHPTDPRRIMVSMEKGRWETELVHSPPG